ncbi:50S ribosomal protein L24 [Microgenomates group bacterium RIFCSPLOWO2_01_FULL_47_10]|nr:ribosomal protein L24 [uncultured bacterium]OGV92389.1 MAG: 50S ribosomal protein L24 [Microgenomates group bacterium RIFCSPLOWO2_01_FULL_47_10]
MKIKKGDIVKILLGRDAGKTGKVTRAYPKKNMVLVEGINIVKRHIKRQNQDQPGGIVEVEKPLLASKVKKVIKSAKPASPTGGPVVKKAKTS